MRTGFAAAGIAALLLTGAGALAQPASTPPSPATPTPSTPGPNPGEAATNAVTNQTKPPGEMDKPLGSGGASGSTTAPGGAPATPTPSR